MWQFGSCTIIACSRLDFLSLCRLFDDQSIFSYYFRITYIHGWKMRKIFVFIETTTGERLSERMKNPSRRLSSIIFFYFVSSFHRIRVFLQEWKVFRTIAEWNEFNFSTLDTFSSVFLGCFYMLTDWWCATNTRECVCTIEWKSCSSKKNLSWWVKKKNWSKERAGDNFLFLFFTPHKSFHLGFHLTLAIDQKSLTFPSKLWFSSRRKFRSLSNFSTLDRNVCSSPLAIFNFSSARWTFSSGLTRTSNLHHGQSRIETVWKFLSS